MDDIGNALSRIDSDKALLRILLVEDDEDDYVIIRDLLSGIEKFELEWVSDYGTALRAIEHEEHDVCLLDYRLGERSGLELLHEASKRGYKAPIILLTGQGGREVDLEATQAGAAGYLVKGQIDASLLERSIRYALARTLKTLGESERRFRSLVQNGSDIITVVDMEGTIRYQSPSIERVLGYRPEGLIGRDAFEHIHPDDLARVQSILVEVINNPGISAPVEVKARHADGSWRYIEAIANNLLDDPTVKGIVVNSRDITERKALEERLAHQASHDPLTNLPNRTLFMAHLEDALARAERYRELVAVLVLDLDDFRDVNDSLGHETGDQVLVAAAERLQVCLRPGDIVARLGGDEFAVLLENITSAAGATEVAERIEDELRKPFAFGEREVLVSASMGIALNTTIQSRPEDLVRNADTAMYRAKDKGRAQYEVYDPSMDTRALERLKLENDLRRAVEREEFVVLYQPKALLQTGSSVGMEALVYWKHPERGLVSPSEFVPVAERSRLVLQIGHRLLREACQQAREWQEKLNSDVPLMVGVNLSARQLRQPSFVEDVAGLLKETGLNPRSLNFKVAEGVAMKDARSTFITLRKLKSLGVQLTINNFGTGYSSLGYLNRFPLDFLEIDRSFVGRLWEDSTDAAVVSGVISLAHALGLTASAEGAETFEQVVQLRRLGCDLAWGNYFSKPLPGEATLALLTSQAEAY